MMLKDMWSCEHNIFLELGDWEEALMISLRSELR